MANSDWSTILAGLFPTRAIHHMRTSHEEIHRVSKYGVFFSKDRSIMETDESIEVADLQVTYNAYGSTIHAEDEEEEEEIANDEEIICNCKGACARKKGQGFCPCKAANKNCSTRCRCPPSKCKNKVNENTRENQNEAIDPDGEVQFAREVQSSETQIEEFLAPLQREDMAYLLRNVLAMGRGSLDFAKNLLQEKDAPPLPPPSPGDTSRPWCKCTVCRPMPNEIENVCCKRVTCITRFQAFNNICLDRDILEVCIKARCDIRADEFNFSMESFRKAAYRQFVLWRFGKLGRGNRRVVPSCAVLSIRRMYPSADGQYMGYRNS